MDIDDMQQQQTTAESMAVDDQSSATLASSCTCPCTCPARRNRDRYSFAIVEDSVGVEAQPFVLVTPEEKPQGLSSSKIRDVVPAAVDHRRNESESVARLKAEIHQLERALHRFHIRPGPLPDFYARAVVPEVKMINGNAIVAECGDVHCGHTVHRQDDNSSSSSSFESTRHRHVSARHIAGPVNNEDISHDLHAVVLSPDGLQFRLKDNGTGVYVIKIGKGVLKHFKSMEIYPSASTLTLRK